ncbi:Poly(ADP-ribose) polymerase and DNA-Ligase Zn-finger region [Pelomyxa schiedti]|nr:Poly(ADP-ribose) polymerase and DNA-Ligase Zn-finger region [Pelomyxa schiedti]
MSAEASYVVEYAKSARAACKQKKCGDKSIPKGELRIGKVYSCERFTEGGVMTDWYHPKCIFEAFIRARAQSVKITSEEDINGFESISPDDQQIIRQLITESVPQYKQVGGKKPAKKKAASKPISASQDTTTIHKPPSSTTKTSTKPTIPSTQPITSCRPTSNFFLNSPSKPAKPKHEVDPDETDEDEPHLPLKRNYPVSSSSGFKAWLSSENGTIIDLTPGSNVIGRGERLEIDSAKCSRNQLEVFVDTTLEKVVVTARGKNPSTLVRSGADPIVLFKGTQYNVSDGDQILVLLRQYPFTLHTSGALQTSNKTAQDGQPSAPNAKLPKLQYSELPFCPHGADCYRTNPSHFLEFQH